MIITYSMMGLLISKYDPFRLLSRSHRCGVLDTQVSVKACGHFHFFPVAVRVLDNFEFILYIRKRVDFEIKDHVIDFYFLNRRCILLVPI